ncbi:potassium transporter TrkH [Oceanicola sp. 22II-s10i]|uniref:TrkH family potassium uptake protein n=1 Tax=Oceanicola sp. 22II-s10i TaxID=1317116 RepID=UPI000B52487B|nr:TrkH family potassium uptake protein [Oceanicola sp. 22II-s10i]OWU83849.1 potassium transporter TrkH [Oceanicola sp. 22II-s10i]
MPFVLFINGALLGVMALAMALIAALFPETRPEFLEGAMLAGLLGAAICLSVVNRLGPPRRVHAFLLTASVWITGATAGAFPLWIWYLSPTDAFFEAMSGITTTGATILSGLDTMEPGVLIWRALLQWIGGIGFIVTGIAFLPILRAGGMQLFRTESSETGDKELASAARFAGATVWVYLGLTGACAFAYELGGMTPFEAAAHALATVSTGGYSTSDASFGHFDSAFLQWSAVVFMLAGGLPFAWYIRLIYGRRAVSEQVRAILIFFAVVILSMSIWLSLSHRIPPFEALRLVAFNVVSVVTTTGFATTDYTLWGPFAVAVFFFLTALGGCTGSTSGGAKAMRWIILARSVRHYVRMIRAPHRVDAIRYEGRAVAPDVVQGVLVFFTLYTATIGALAAVLALYGLDMDTAISGALTSVANVGPGVGGVIGPAGNYAPLPDGAKWALALGMYAGRLELMTVFVLFMPAFWREVF